MMKIGLTFILLLCGNRDCSWSLSLAGRYPTPELQQYNTQVACIIKSARQIIMT
jgi:hypothetical protein